MTIFRDDLERVYALLEDPKRWTQGKYARNAAEEETNIDDDDAVCWCLDGAVMRCGLRNPEAWGALGVNLIAFNDNHTHPEVLALLKSAIERAPVRP